VDKKTLNFIFEKKISIPQSSNFAEGNFPISTGYLIDKLKKRRDWIFITTFSPDGIHFASGGFNSSILLWNIFKDKPIKSLNGHEDWILTLTFSHDGKYLLSGSRDNLIILWSVQDKKIINKFEGHQNRISSLAFSSDDTQIASGGYDSTIKIWNIDSKNPINVIDTSPLWPTSICYANNFNSLIAGFNDGTINIYDLKSFAPINTLNIFQSWVDSIKCSKDETLFYSSNTDGFIKIIDIKTNKLIFNKQIPFRASQFPYNERSLNFVDDLSIYVMLNERNPEHFLNNLRNFDQKIKSLEYKIFLEDHKDFCFDFSKNLDIIAYSERSNYIYTIDLNTQESLKIDALNSWAKTISISNDNSLLSAGGYDGEIKIFSLKTGYLINSIIDHASWINSIKFSNDSKFIAAGLNDGTIIIIKIKDTEIIAKFNLRSRIYKVDFSNDNKFILTSTLEGELFQIDLKTKDIELIQKLENSWISNFVFLNDGKSIITASNEGYIYLIKDKTILNSSKVHNSEIIMLSILDENSLITGSFDLFLKQINPKDLSITYEKRFDGLPLGYNKNLNQLFISHFRNISVYKKVNEFQELERPSLEKPELEFQFDFNSKSFSLSKNFENIFVLKGPNKIEITSLKDSNTTFQINPQLPITAFCNNNNSNKLLLGHENSEIEVYDIEKNELVKKLSSYEGEVSSLSLSIDESFLISGFEDGTLELWLFNKGKNLWCIKSNLEPVSELTFSYNKMFFTSKNKYSFDTDLWSTIEGTKLGTFSNKRFCFKNFEFSPDGESVLYLNDKNQLLVWFLKEGKEISIPERSDFFITYFSYSKDSSKIILGYNDGSLMIFSSESDFIREEIGIDSPITFITFKDNKYFFTSHLDGTIRSHSLKEPEDFKPIAAHHSSIDFLMCNAEKNLLASYSSIEHILKIWKI
jgi:WD40 repeat protein